VNMTFPPVSQEAVDRVKETRWQIHSSLVVNQAKRIRERLNEILPYKDAHSYAFRAVAKTARRPV
jgi:hypothetical protein